MLILSNRLMREAQVMISHAALKPYPSKLFQVTDLQAAFMSLSEPAPSTAVINLEPEDTKGTVPVSAMRSFLRASVLIAMLVSPLGYDCLIRCGCFVSADRMSRWPRSELYEM